MKLQRRLAINSNAPGGVAAINVVLLLLFFVLLSSPFVLQPGVVVDPPRGALGSGVPSSRLIVSVAMIPSPDAVSKNDKTPGIFFADQLVTLEGLTRALRELKRENTSTPLVVRADRSVPLGVVAEVMNAGLANGLSVVLATQNENGSASTAP